MKQLLFVIAVAMTWATVGCASGNMERDEPVASLQSEQEKTDSSAPGPKDGKVPQDPEEARLAFAECMRKNGVDLPDPNENGMVEIGPEDNIDPVQMQEAEKKCAAELQAMGAAVGAPEGNQELADGLLEVAKCLRGKGFDVPDPQVGPDGRVSALVTTDEGDSDPTQKPGFAQAEAECMQEAGVELPGAAPADGS